MNKIVFLFLILLMQFANANSMSNNAFNINIDKTPTSDGEKKDNDDNGKITAITLGSIFSGLALGGIAYNYFKKGINLEGFCVKSKIDAITPICCDKDIIKYYLKRENRFLNQIFIDNKFDLTCSKKYIFIEDNFIKNNSYNRFFFKADKDYSHVKVYQYSYKFDKYEDIPNLNTMLFDNNDVISLEIKKMDMTNGVLVKEGDFYFKKNEFYFIDTSLIGKDVRNVYALVLEFE